MVCRHRQPEGQQPAAVPGLRPGRHLSEHRQPGGNQLVETVSTDGITFLPVTNPNVGTTDCAGTAVNCVTDNEGISGNQVVDPKTGNVFIAHTTTNGGSGSAVGVQVSEGRIDLSGPSPTGTWTESPNLDAALCPNTQKKCVDASGNPTELAGENFASIARDAAGFLYVAFTAGPVDHKNSNDANFGQLTEPEQIYVVRSLQPATMADPSKVTWSKPMRITGPNRGISHGTNTFPWITAGSKGRVGVAWYHTSTTSDKGAFGASVLANAEWTVQVGESLNAAGKSPTWRQARSAMGRSSSAASAPTALAARPAATAASATSCRSARTGRARCS